MIGKWKKIKFFKTLFSNKNSNSLSHKKFTLILFFAQKMVELWLFFSFLLLRPPRTSETLKKGSNFGFLTLKSHLSTAVAQREKKCKQFVFNKYFSLVLGVLKSKISKKFGEGFLKKLDFKLFHYKAMIQPVSKITTIATRNRRWI